jgi:hypothetical protein
LSGALRGEIIMMGFFAGRGDDVRTGKLGGVLLVSFAVALGFGCHRGGGRVSRGLTGDPSQRDCGFTVVDQPTVPRRVACLNGELLAGPVTYERTMGKPKEELLSFIATQPGTACLQVTSDGVTSATVLLDDIVMLKPAAFDSDVTTIEARAEVDAGTHRLRAREWMSRSVTASPYADG